MLKRLTEQKLEEILEAGISEFGERGLEQTSMNRIAARAEISVGVLYKYYENKDFFFLACVRKSLGELEKALSEIEHEEDNPLQYAERLISTLQKHCQEHPSHIRMYHELTCAGSGRFSPILAQEIEGMTAHLYSAVFEKARCNEMLRPDTDPQLFAFFFDNLLMMLQFTYCCSYYRERFRLYYNTTPENADVQIRNELLKFLKHSFTLKE